MPALSSYSRIATLFAAILLVAVVVFPPKDTLAGPPLVCDPLEIGNAKSLPTGNEPFGYEPKYDRTRLVEETLDLLTAEMPVIVRMETLRRATLYASRNLHDLRYGGRRGADYSEDRRIAFELLARLMARALEADSRGTPDALVWFDVGYLMECLDQAMLVRGFEGYELVKKAASLRGGDPEMEFALALITKHPVRDEHDSHVRKARAGMQPGTLLAINFERHLEGEGTN
jgi:hypothetical protein